MRMKLALFVVMLFNILVANAYADALGDLVGGQVDQVSTSDVGRKVVDAELRLNNNLLSKDMGKVIIGVSIPREGLPLGIRVEDPMQAYKEITDELYKGFINEYLENLRETNYEEYLKKDKERDVLYKGNPTKMGPFFRAELLFPLTEKFGQIPLNKFYTQFPELSVWKVSKEEKPRIHFQYIEPGLITVTATTQSYLKNDANKPSSLFIGTSTAKFNIQSGKVSFTFSYNFDGKKKTWTDNDPFAKKGASFIQLLKDLF